LTLFLQPDENMAVWNPSHLKKRFLRCSDFLFGFGDSKDKIGRQIIKKWGGSSLSHMKVPRTIVFPNIRTTLN